MLFSSSACIGEKHFLDADQLIFAKLSGDYNPVHMDEMAARRLLAGKQVVHGLHLVLWAMEYWFYKNSGIPQGVKCDFKNPVCVGDKVVFFQEKIKNNKSIIRGSVNGLLCLKITLLFDVETHRDENPNDNSTYTDYVLLENVPVPFEKSPQDQVGRKFKIGLLAVDGKNEFSHCQSRLGDCVFSGLCSLSFFVGMVCPGLHSLFSTLNIRLNVLDKSRSHLFYSVDSFDPRFALFHISVSGVISGELTAFQRPAPVQQASLATLVDEIKTSEFAGTRSLIIGGSRGLGEYTAKLLVAGGGDVVLTYSQGLGDVQRVCDELNAFRPGSGKIQKYNILEDSVEGLALQDIQSIDAVYFFATPKIFRKKYELFDIKIFDEFFYMYVLRFYALCSYLESVRTNPIKIFLPSSVAVTERPDDLAEYAMAKMSSELLAEEINKSYKRVSVVVLRLPRLETDQTATISKVPAAPMLDTMLLVTRLVSGKP